jgi:hypothetical protein
VEEALRTLALTSGRGSYNLRPALGWGLERPRKSHLIRLCQEIHFSTREGRYEKGYEFVFGSNHAVRRAESGAAQEMNGLTPPPKVLLIFASS